MGKTVIDPSLSHAPLVTPAFGASIELLIITLPGEILSNIQKIKNQKSDFRQKQTEGLQ